MDDSEYPAYLKGQSLDDLMSIKDTLDGNARPVRYGMVLAEIATRETQASVGADDLVPLVVAEMDANVNRKRTVLQSLGTLALTLIVFVSLGLFQNSISGILILVGVIFLHECGHFIGMRLLGYKDVQMFFIPLFGAAVSGVETVPSG